MKEAYQNKIIELEKRIAELEKIQNEMVQLSDLEKNPKKKKEKFRQARQHYSYFVLNSLKSQVKISQMLLKRELSNEGLAAKARNKELLEKINKDLIKSNAISYKKPKTNNTQKITKEGDGNLTLGDHAKNFVLNVFIVLIILGFIVFSIYVFLFVPGSIAPGHI